MFVIDQYAYTNKLKDTHPLEKLMFAVMTMCIAIAAKAFVIHMIVILIMGFMTLIIAGIPRKIYIGLLSLPLSFVLLGILPILIIISKNDIGYLYSFKLFNFYWGITDQGLHTSLLLMLRSLSAAMCLYFVSLTTPMIDVIEMLKKLKLPSTLIEIISLIYRFIFVLLESSVTIYHSQSARLGYSSIGTSFRSLGKLVSMVFIKAYSNSQALYTSLLSRGYNGDLNVLAKGYTLDKRNLALIVLFDAGILIVSLVYGG